MATMVDARPARRTMTGEEIKVITASSAGTIFEWYDFYLYGSLAAVIGAKFFSAFDPNTRAIFGRSYVDEPDRLVNALAEDEAIAAADTLLVTVPNTLGVDYNAHVISNILEHVAPALGWR